MKAHKERLIPVSDDVASMCRKYLEATRVVFPDTDTMHLYRNGMPLALVAEWLGHSKMDSTKQYYANADTTMKREAIEKGKVYFDDFYIGCFHPANCLRERRQPCGPEAGC